MRETLSDDTNKYSSKRVVAFILTLTLVIVVIANTFFKFDVEEYVFEGLVNVLIWSLGFVGSEQFAGVLKKRFDQKPQRPNTKPNHEDEENF